MNNLADYMSTYNQHLNEYAEGLINKYDVDLEQLANEQQEKINEFNNKTQNAHDQLVGYLQGLNNHLGLDPAGGTLL